MIARLRAHLCRHDAALVQMRRTTREEVRVYTGKRGAVLRFAASTARFDCLCLRRRRVAVAQADQKRDPGLETAGKSGECPLKHREREKWRSFSTFDV
jgi:hypothetical protein